MSNYKDEMNGAEPVAPKMVASLVVYLFGTVRGKVVASLAHAYALAEFKLTLPPATENAPWRNSAKPQDYFEWRRSVVEERDALRLTLAGILHSDPIAPDRPAWPLSRGVSLYNPELANAIAQQYARWTCKIMGLGGDKASKN
jgi:hypothetical protein